MSRVATEKKIKVVQKDAPQKQVETSQKVPEHIECPSGYYEVQNLPSKMKFYPEGTKIFARPLKILDVKKLSSMSEETADETIREVLKSSVVGIDVDDILLADKYYIIYWQRANTYVGDHFAIECECEDCHKKERVNFTVDQLEVKSIKDDCPFLNEIELPSGNKVELGYLRIGDEAKIAEALRMVPGADPDVMNLSAVIKTINGEEKSTKEKYDFLTAADMSDVLVITKLLTENELSIVPSIKHVCTGCGRSAEIDISFQPNFFIPEYLL